MYIIIMRQLAANYLSRLFFFTEKHVVSLSLLLIPLCIYQGCEAAKMPVTGVGGGAAVFRAIMALENGLAIAAALYAFTYYIILWLVWLAASATVKTFRQKTGFGKKLYILLILLGMPFALSIAFYLAKTITVRSILEIAFIYFLAWIGFILPVIDAKIKARKK